MRATTAPRARCARLSPRARLQVGASLLTTGVVLAALHLVVDGPFVVAVLGLLCIASGSSMIGTQLQRRSVERDRLARERRIAVQRRPWPGTDGGSGEDPGPRDDQE